MTTTIDPLAPDSTGAFGPEITAPGLHQWLITHALKDQPRDGGVLDLGCGQGAWLRRLDAAGFKRLRGVDWNTPPVDTGNLKITIGDLEAPEIGLGDEKFALVTLIEIIEHMHNPGHLLRQAAKHLAPGGIILITTPNIHSLIQRLKFLVTGKLAHFDSGSDPTHYQPVLLDAWRRMLPHYGLRLVEEGTWPDANRLGGINPIWRMGASVLSLGIANRLPGECLVLKLARV